MNINSLDIYKIWAPIYTEWAAWAKPVLFASLPSKRASALDIPEVPVSRELKTMIIVDLPGVQSVEESLAFAAKGWRPVPLYNGVMGQGKMLVDVYELGKALHAGADMLKTLSLPLDAPPVFMLDLKRMDGSRSPGAYDNRWCVFPQDMPSADYVISKGINKVIVRSARYVMIDLERILYDYQKNGLSLYVLLNDESSPKELFARKQSFADEWAYRLRVTMKLKRNATGGFGGRIPEPQERSGSGGAYYRIG